MAISRPYRAAFSKEQVIDEFTRCASTQFDPNIARTMIEILRN
jgi:HD-GYP domain-containing protein (c-di-GMP phosphodiesterase class II)